MIDTLKLLEEGDLVSFSTFSKPCIIQGAFSSSNGWLVVIKDYNYILFYNIEQDNWKSSTDTLSWKDISNVIFYKKLDKSTVRDIKLTEILK